MVEKKGNRVVEHQSRLRDSLCQHILESVRAHAIREKLPGDHSEDCALEFLARKLTKGGFVSYPLSAAEETRLQSQAQVWARRYAFRLRRRRKREVLLTEIDATGECMVREPVARDLGPEELLIQAELFERLIAPLTELTASQQQLFARHILEATRLVDLQEETGRTPDALWQAMVRIRKRMVRLLEGKGVTSSEVMEYLGELARPCSLD